MTTGVRYDRAYAPFGEVYAELNGNTENRTFTGPQEDTTPGIDDFLYRQYSASQGRWLVPDPAGMGAVDITNPQTWNRYTYVGNNPLNTVDPLGLHWPCYTSAFCSWETDQSGNSYFAFDFYSSEQLSFNGQYGSTVWTMGPDGEGIPNFIPSAPDLGYAGFWMPGEFEPTPGAPSNSITCPAVPFKITGVGPNQAPGITAITQTPRSQIPVGGVAIKLDNFRTGSLAGTNWRPVIEGITLTAAWGPGQAPAGIPTLGPYSPVDTISANGVVSTGAPNQIDVYGYTSQSQAFASTRTVMVTGTIPANSIGVRCPVTY